MRLALVMLAACATAPRFAHVEPAAIAAAPSARVRIEPGTQPWWAVVNHADFWFALPVHTAAVPGVRLRPVRTSSVALDEPTYAAVACAWKIGADCGSLSEARAVAHAPLSAALDDLRARVAALGGNVAADTRCFAVRDRLWCEADALRAEGEVAEVDPEGPPSEPAAPSPTRFALSADASVSMVGSVLAPGTTVALWYRPIEVGFEVVDLSRDGTARGLVGVGGTALARFGVRPQLDVIAGGSTTAIAPNGATNPHFTGLYEGFVGASYRSQWRWHMGNGFVQLQVGGAREDAVTRPMVGLHIGLVTPGG
jgi:hypothetical protein